MIPPCSLKSRTGYAELGTTAGIKQKELTDKQQTKKGVKEMEKINIQLKPIKGVNKMKYLLRQMSLPTLCICFVLSAQADSTGETQVSGQGSG